MLDVKRKSKRIAAQVETDEYERTSVIDIPFRKRYGEQPNSISTREIMSFTL